jgi:hypothetical protein
MPGCLYTAAVLVHCLSVLLVSLHQQQCAYIGVKLHENRAIFSFQISHSSTPAQLKSKQMSTLGLPRMTILSHTSKAETLAKASARVRTGDTTSVQKLNSVCKIQISDDLMP